MTSSVEFEPGRKSLSAISAGTVVVLYLIKLKFVHDVEKKLMIELVLALKGKFLYLTNVS